MVTTAYGQPVKVRANPHQLTGIIKNVVVFDNVAFGDLYYKDQLVGRCTNHGQKQGWIIRAVQK